MKTVEVMGHWKLMGDRLHFEEGSAMAKISGDKGFLTRRSEGRFSLTTDSGEIFFSRFNIPLGGAERIRPGTNYRGPYGEVYRSGEIWRYQE